MKNIVLSTAAFCLWGIEPETKLDICRHLGFSHVQIALSTERMVWNLVRHLEASGPIEGFERVSLHAPWCGVTYGNTPKTQRLLEGLKRIGQFAAVDETVFRVSCVRDIDVLRASGLAVCIENTDRDPGFRKLAGIAGEAGLPLAFNINRAVRCGENVAGFLNQYGHQVSRILISGFESGSGRMPLVYTGQTHLLSALQSAVVPIVLEGLFAPGDTASIALERRVTELAVAGLLRQIA